MRYEMGSHFPRGVPRDIDEVKLEGKCEGTKKGEITLELA